MSRVKRKLTGYIPLLFLGAIFCAPVLQGCNTKQEKQQADARPNIILIMADDMGFSDIGSYGGEVQTPAIDGLAREGLRYTQFYNNARCCPTRASLMTGLYPHQTGMGWMTAADLGTPQYQGELNRQCVTIAEVLKTAGYDTYMTGKWHLSRVRNIKGEVKDNWPVQRGFDQFFGIVDGAANYFTPELVSDNKKYKAPGEDFYLTHAISDSSVRYLDQHFNGEKTGPLFMYVAYNAPHWPLHALREDINKYKEIYRAGWDSLRKERFEKQKKMGFFDPSVKLSPRDEAVPAWEDIPEDKKEAFVMRMAIYAAQIDAMDQGIGRIVSKLKELGQWENTLLFFLSDNGACAEFINGGESKAVTGKKNTWQSYRIHWANLSSTPYRQYKHWIHEGGIATPFIVHWPAGIDAALNNSFVREPGHLVDIMATIVDVTDARYPETYQGQAIHPTEGQSLVPHFSGEKNNRKPVYWEHEGNIGVRDGKWKLVAKTAEDAAFDPETLELYDMENDPVELHDLADTYPDKRQALYEDWKAWATRVKVFPLDTRNYGERARAYQRQINGEFAARFGGWTLNHDSGLQVFVDTTGRLSGANSARIKAQGTDIKDNTAILHWPLFVKEGESFRVSGHFRGDEGIKIKMVFETADGNRLMEKPVTMGPDMLEVSGTTGPAGSDGRYRLGFYAEHIPPGAGFWMDNVQLIPLDK